MVFNATTVSISVASPKSVVTPQNHHPHVEPISLIHNNNKKKTSNGNDGSVIEQRQGMNSTHHHSQGGIVSEGDAWFCPVSEKANRTTNPIRAIVDPIVSKIKLGCQRSDGKDPISLAVSFFLCLLVVVFLDFFLFAPLLSFSCCRVPSLRKIHIRNKRSFLERSPPVARIIFLIAP